MPQKVKFPGVALPPPPILGQTNDRYMHNTKGNFILRFKTSFQDLAHPIEILGQSENQSPSFDLGYVVWVKLI